MQKNLEKNILVTGGTGTFGKAFVKKLLDLRFTNIAILSRDELKQFELRDELGTGSIKYFLGDVRDFERVRQVVSNMDIVIHAAAMKQVPASESNPLEAIKTNILGTENIIRASIENSVEKVIALSTDKATNPTSLYGATKLCADKLVIAGNFFPNNISTKFSVVRYGNVLGSRGSVIPLFKHQVKSNTITITDARMTRFWITIEQAVNFVMDRIPSMQGGEIFVPKIPSFKIIDVARVVAPATPIEVIGIRPGEKIHEIMINTDDALNTYDLGDFYVIVSPSNPNIQYYESKGKGVPENFSYSSENNTRWFNLESFEMLLKSINLI